ncbi:MAG: transporter, family, tartrate transporter [Blastocatellia bacterium]|nr:transporter, family, tartrate transporter [Blastocatellia bacterium]
METNQNPILDSVADRARRRITRRIMPYLSLLFAIAFLDRVNVGYAALQMKGDLGFTDDVLGFGAGIFFIGYFLLEIPGSILVEKWSARGWIARIMISWGVVAILMGFVRGRNEFYVLRFLLGAAEAGFFPGIIVYLSHWFRYQDRAKAVAMFMAAIPIANIVGSPVSGLLLGAHWLGLAGWRWLFIVEGAPAIVLGVITIFFLTDRPHQANWLAEDERRWITEELDRELQAKRVAHSYRIREAFRHREVIILTLAYFFIVTAVYGFNFWLPTLIKKASGSSNLTVTLVSALPYCFALAAILLVGWSSDRTKERRWHTAICMMVAGTGLLLSVFARDHVALAVSMFCVAAAGMYGYLPSFWSLPTSFLSGTAAAASVGLINSVGNLGGFAGPYIVGYLSKRTNSFIGGMLYLSVSAFLAAGLVLSLRATRGREGLAALNR